MIKKNILFITTTYRTGEKVYPILPELNKIHKVDVLNLFDMSRDTKWQWSFDPRQDFYTMCDNLGIESIHGPGVVGDKSVNVKKYGKFIDNFKNLLKYNYYDLVFLDNNMQDKNMGWDCIYQFFSKQEIPYIGSPHGNREHKKYKILKRIGNYYDYSFIFGEKEKRFLNKYGKKYYHHIDRILPAGIPSNDTLKDYHRGNKHILVIPNFTIAPPKTGTSKKFKPFTVDAFKKLKLHKLSEEYNCPIVIKEKYRIFYEDGFLERSLKDYKSIVSFISVCEDENRLISDASCVISAFSTLAFKPIQLGIPTVLLNGSGMIGNFYDFPGIIDTTYDSMRKSLSNQEKNGRLVDFISDTLSGGLEYNSTQLYIDYINKILNGEATK